MNILVIGNGFDLAHGLPTKYGDFLEFVKVMQQVIDVGVPNDKIDYGELSQEIKTLVKERIDTINKDEWKELIKENKWIKYFLWNPLYEKENWIDFESEISNVIQAIDNDMHGLTDDLKLSDIIEHISVDFFDVRYSDKKRTYKEMRDELLIDLNGLIRALELYLYEFVEQVKCNKMSPDISKIVFDKVLSFNYTDTYKKIYDIKGLSEYDYIHGKIDVGHSLSTNNMVLGIDEYLPEERKNRDVEFIAFKKYYQRIYKETGCKYKEWVDDIGTDMPIRNLKFAYVDKDGSRVYQSENSKYHNLYIFGHSLDITDKDILQDLILNDNVYSTIFYYNKDDLGTKIANLVKVIGQDELIRRTGGSTKTIEFKLQQNMVERI